MYYYCYDERKNNSQEQLKCNCNKQKPYIFVSYSHRDSKEVHEIIKELYSAGYNVWFDEGIDPGTEWDQFIASTIKGSSFFIAFLSQNYLESDNCKDELNFARDCNMERLLVYLENVELPDGMQMRLSRLQAIYKNKYANLSAFLNKLASTSGLENTKLVSERLEQNGNFTIENGTLIKYHGKDDSIIVPNNVSVIDDQAFEDCDCIATVVLPDSITDIGSTAFLNCKKLTNISLPNSLMNIGTCSFASCKSLANVHIPDKVTSVNIGLFVGCISLKEVFIPNSITCIEGSAFNGCKSLISMTIPNSVKSIGKRAFKGCAKLKEIVYEGTKTQWNEIEKRENWQESIERIKCIDGIIELKP